MTAKKIAPKSQKKRPISQAAVSELESHLGFWLRFVSNHVSARFKAAVEAEGVSVSEWVALRQIFQQQESSTGELITALGMTKGAVSKVISRLEQKGLVERQSNSEDKRAQHICLTESGRALVPVLADLADRNDNAFFEHLTSAQRDELIAAMKEIVRVHHLKEMPTN